MYDGSSPSGIGFVYDYHLEPVVEKSNIKTISVEGKKYKAVVDPSDPTNLIAESLPERLFIVGDIVKNKEGQIGIITVPPNEINNFCWVSNS